ncbi:CLUMA_CG006755, isoform A [Clunio marinus]|uniref:CLUMA_CG006755, isoform A n=1 Tax=Clunio marinus TaxID=568069 RepID=A0A1J1HZ27_9DIPT|nr:CLUMA_CG006755, isoform A [Clunio marinus]
MSKVIRSWKQRTRLYSDDSSLSAKYLNLAQGYEISLSKNFNVRKDKNKTKHGLRTVDLNEAKHNLTRKISDLQCHDMKARRTSQISSSPQLQCFAKESQSVECLNYPNNQKATLNARNISMRFCCAYEKILKTTKQSS